MAHNLMQDEDLSKFELICPYNSAHKVRSIKMNAHLMKCRRVYGSQGMKKCPFNAAHEVPALELRFHMSNCPDRHTVEHRIAEAEYHNSRRSAHGCVELPAYKPLKTTGESWEDRHENVVVREPPEPLQPEPRPQRVLITEEEARGLNPRQRQNLYIKKVREQQAQKQAARASCSVLREPQQSGSQSLALLKQQQHQKASEDMYQELKGPRNGVVAKGRGRGLGFGATPPLGRGVNRQPENRPPGATAMAGLVQGGLGQQGPHLTGMDRTFQEPMQPFGRGIGRSQMAAPPFAKRPGPPFSAVPGTGRGDFRQTGDNSGCAQLLSSVNLNGDNLSLCTEKDKQKEASMACSDDHIQNAHSWIGGGYGDITQTTSAGFFSQPNFTTNDDFVEGDDEDYPFTEVRSRRR